ncbi:MAG: NAD/NADP octopine/nopaline dehydrogenase family protein [Planctomycetes bacterium]|nr:NAD/NADP octopine/nopaline dehydrogenase family protein [Planctomycetota bacterium]
MKVLVVGSGHGGCAMAAILAKRGHRVGILKLGNKMHLENFNCLKQRKSIRLYGTEGTGDFPLSLVTTQPAQAVPWADVIFIYYVSNYHPFVAERIAPYLNSSQLVVINPGYLGSLIFCKEIKKDRSDRTPLFAEFETLPFSSRIIQPGCVKISSKNIRHPFAAYPASNNRTVKKILTPLLGDCVERTSLIEVALHNPNLIIHTIGVLMNVSLVENPKKTFAMYKDGFSKSIWNLVFALDQEKMNVLEAIGAEKRSYFDEFRLRTFEDNSIDAIEGFNRYANEAPDGPFAIDHRYITEDLPMGLGLLYSLGNALAIDTPICKSLINLADAFLPQYNFWSNIRTIDQFANGNIREFINILKFGSSQPQKPQPQYQA